MLARTTRRTCSSSTARLWPIDSSNSSTPYLPATRQPLRLRDNRAHGAASSRSPGFRVAVVRRGPASAGDRIRRPAAQPPHAAADAAVGARHPPAGLGRAAVDRWQPGAAASNRRHPGAQRGAVRLAASGRPRPHGQTLDTGRGGPGRVHGRRLSLLVANRPPRRSDADRQDRLPDGGRRAANYPGATPGAVAPSLLSGVSLDRGPADRRSAALRDGEVRAGRRNVRHPLADAGSAAGTAGLGGSGAGAPGPSAQRTGLVAPARPRAAGGSRPPPDTGSGPPLATTGHDSGHGAAPREVGAGCRPTPALPR